MSTQEPVYYHSRLDFDPLRKGRRVTLCAVIVGDRIHFGISKGHKLDVRKWNKKLGREISLGRAKESPMLIKGIPTEKIKHFMVETMKELCLDWLLTGPNGKRLDEQQIGKKLEKRRKHLDDKQKQLDGEAASLVSVTTRLHEIFHPAPVQEKVEEFQTV